MRSTDAESGKQRLQKHLESYLLWNESFSDRIIPVVGDLSQRLLGLSDQQFQLIASQIDLIYHNGATINLIYPYSVLKAANVLRTQEVLWLASQSKLKPVHYISTLSVLSLDMETTMDMTPVDFVSQAIVSLAHQKKSLGKVFHIYNPQPSSLTELLNWIRSFGYPLQKIVDNQWQTEILNNPEDFIDNPLYTLIPFFKEDFVFDMNLDERYQSNLWNGAIQGNVTDEYAWAVRQSYAPEEKIGKSETTTFQLLNGAWQRSDVTWLVQGYSKSEVISALEKVGFTEVNIYDAEHDFAITGKAGNAYFICHKS